MKNLLQKSRRHMIVLEALSVVVSQIPTYL